MTYLIHFKVSKDVTLSEYHFWMLTEFGISGNLRKSTLHVSRILMKYSYIQKQEWSQREVLSCLYTDVPGDQLHWNYCTDINRLSYILQSIFLSTLTLASRNRCLKMHIY